MKKKNWKLDTIRNYVYMNDFFRGISASRRSELWQVFTRSDEMKYNSARSYESLLMGTYDADKSKDEIDEILDTIDKDVERTCVEVLFKIFSY
jgi:hypothetical protein